MVSLDKYNGSCNFADDLSTKISVWNEIKIRNVKLFVKIAQINEAKTLIKHI